MPACIIKKRFKYCYCTIYYFGVPKTVKCNNYFLKKI